MCICNKFKVVNTEITDTELIHDIIIPGWENITKKIYFAKTKWDKIRGYNIYSSHVSMIESEIDENKYILDKVIPEMKSDYRKFWEKTNNMFNYENSTFGVNKKIKPITQAFSNITDFQIKVQKLYEVLLKIESNFNERERAWKEYITWGIDGFMNDVLHDLRVVENFENTEYYDEAISIIRRFKNIKI